MYYRKALNNRDRNLSGMQKIVYVNEFYVIELSDTF
jgi:hypothetical protein